VWEGEKLRAVFCDVRGFRDLGIPLAMKIERETGSATWEQDSSGNFERTEKRAIEAHPRRRQVTVLMAAPDPKCGFCHGKPVLNAEAWTRAGAPKYAPCPRCGGVPR
jgi:hypothetical protein